MISFFNSSSFESESAGPMVAFKYDIIPGSSGVFIDSTFGVIVVAVLVEAILVVAGGVIVEYLLSVFNSESFFLVCITKHRIHQTNQN